MVCTCRSWHGEKPAWHVPINPQLTGGARKVTQMRGISPSILKSDIFLWLTITPSFLATRLLFSTSFFVFQSLHFSLALCLSLPFSRFKKWWQGDIWKVHLPPPGSGGSLQCMSLNSLQMTRSFQLAQLCGEPLPLCSGCNWDYHQLSAAIDSFEQVYCLNIKCWFILDKIFLLQ